MAVIKSIENYRRLFGIRCGYFRELHLSDLQSKPRFLTVLSISILLFVFIPVTFSAVYFINNTYQDALVRAQNNVDLEAKTTALEVKNKLATLHYELLTFSQSPVMGEVAVNLLYSQFVVKQLQKLVQRNTLITGAFIADGSDFIVEGYPYEILRIGTGEFQKMTNKLISIAVDDNTSKLLILDHQTLTTDYMELLNDGANILFYLPLKKKVDSLVSPFKVTAGLFVLIDTDKLTTAKLSSDGLPDIIEMDIGGRKVMADEKQTGVDYLVANTSTDLTLSHFDKEEPHQLNLTYYSATSHYTTDIESAVINTLIFMLIMLIVVLLALAFFASHITGPLRHLLDFSRRLSKGNYTEFDYDANYQEFNELISHLNGMATTIQKQLSGLEKEKENAEASEKIKARFLANMSHEIRTPLNGILGLLNMLDKHELDHQAKDWVTASLSTSNLLLHIVNDILDFSKLEEDKVEIESTTFSVREIVASVINPHESLIEDKGLSLTINFEHNMREFWIGDPMRISQVLLNLISNATKFTNVGGIRLNVSAIFIHHQWFLELEIVDTGIGISAEQQSKLFQSFQQADISTTRKFGGTGLGLSIAHKLVHLMGGEISVKSEVGKGTTFKVSVAVLETQQKEQSEDIHVYVPDLTHITILVAEDNKINQLIISHILKPTMVKLVIVEDGKQAVEACKTQNFDIILMDVQMPIMDGLQATVALRKQGFEMPIIMQTANVLVDEIDSYLKSGATAHIAKPIVDSVLYKTIQHCLTPELFEGQIFEQE
ncbi:response regulator [Psychrosphaera sp. B3R10]|uniref:ATP-binding protein n=1 Tax=unclassified Psychrosphaera TaxID=2641570 RepID=UPI001C09F98A|nr:MULTISPECIES: ATP-binding protein [unclassified Psychrosphaera]MBU2882629.1 response regulator [Psychrosphaera sp. I2R16]MBU2989352.1 response regulator [Psychrosphaera sp. B3R10]